MPLSMLSLPVTALPASHPRSGLSQQRFAKTRHRRGRGGLIRSTSAARIGLANCALRRCSLLNVWVGSIVRLPDALSALQKYLQELTESLQCRER